MIPDPPPLPEYLSEHERRASRVDMEVSKRVLSPYSRRLLMPLRKTLYADSPVDASMLSLYVHQNYTQYCDTLEQCYAEADMLSWTDSSGGETVRNVDCLKDAY